MGRDDFAETIACFMRVAWAAAVGRINLAGGRQRLSSQSSDDEGSTHGGAGSDTESVKSFRSSVSSGNPSEVTNKVHVWKKMTVAYSVKSGAHYFRVAIVLGLGSFRRSVFLFNSALVFSVVLSARPRLVL